MQVDNNIQMPIITNKPGLFVKKPLYALYLAQFLSAFVDNMIMLIALAIINRDAYPSYYLPLVQSAFLIPYIIFSPWVGRFADRMSKSKVLLIGNAIKAMGILAFFIGLDPVISNFIVGIGAVVYSPAKYGILPLLTNNEESLLNANSRIETFTIIAILTGTVGGGFLADKSIMLALVVSLILYILSMVVNTFIPNNQGDKNITYKNAPKDFYKDLLTIFKNRKCHYGLFGTSSFWMASSVFRLIIMAWVPITLNITNGTVFSIILSLASIGIIIGATVAPHIITMKTYYKTVWFGFAMAAAILSFTLIGNLPLTVIGLILIGAFGGIFIVPMNACIQHEGHKSIGAGRTIAIQNFVEFGLMFLGVAAYTIAQKYNVPSNYSIIVTSVTLTIGTTYILFYNRKNKA